MVRPTTIIYLFHWPKVWAHAHFHHCCYQRKILCKIRTGRDTTWEEVAQSGATCIAVQKKAKPLWSHNVNLHTEGRACYSVLRLQEIHNFPNSVTPEFLFIHENKGMIAEWYALIKYITLHFGRREKALIRRSGGSLATYSAIHIRLLQINCNAT